MSMVLEVNNIFVWYGFFCTSICMHALLHTYYLKESDYFEVSKKYFGFMLSTMYIHKEHKYHFVISHSWLSSLYIYAGWRGRGGTSYWTSSTTITTMPGRVFLPLVTVPVTAVTVATAGVR
jgi:hypothetical protein